MLSQVAGSETLIVLEGSSLSLCPGSGVWVQCRRITVQLFKSLSWLHADSTPTIFQLYFKIGIVIFPYRLLSGQSWPSAFLDPLCILDLLRQKRGRMKAKINF